MSDIGRKRAGRNRTITLTESDRSRLRARLLCSPDNGRVEEPAQGTIKGDLEEWLPRLPSEFVDLLILDPPYNLTKSFGGLKFQKRATGEYTAWLDRLISGLKPLLKQTASVYICGDWVSSVSIFAAASSHFIVRNRITWEREKGRGARSNWKNSSEDIWFCTVSDTYTFNVDAVKLRRRVLAPYTHPDGSAKDWTAGEEGAFRDTHPSNLWSDITVPFWSMPENTDHPTQKSEKLIARLVLASTNEGDFVFDPFLGSGTTSVVATKLGRRYLGIESNEEYCLVAERRLEAAEQAKEIQGFTDGVFWERNTLLRRRESRSTALGIGATQGSLPIPITQVGAFFLRTDPVHKTLAELASKLDKEGISYALVGAMALDYHGFARVTQNIDLIMTLEHLRRFREVSVALGYPPAFPGANKHYQDIASGVRIDVIIAGEYPGDGQPKPIAFPDPSGSHQVIDAVRVVKLTKLIELKLASRLSAAHRICDLGDVQKLIEFANLPRDLEHSLDLSVRSEYLRLWDATEKARQEKLGPDRE